MSSVSSKAILEAALNPFLKSVGDEGPKLLYSLYYEQEKCL